jgi:hypothetical protein
MVEVQVTVDHERDVLELHPDGRPAPLQAMAARPVVRVDVGVAAHAGVDQQESARVVHEVSQARLHLWRTRIGLPWRGARSSRSRRGVPPDPHRLSVPRRTGGPRARARASPSAGGRVLPASTERHAHDAVRPDQRRAGRLDAVRLAKSPSTSVTSPSSATRTTSSGTASRAAAAAAAADHAHHRRGGGSFRPRDLLWTPRRRHGVLGYAGPGSRRGRSERAGPPTSRHRPCHRP